MNARRLSAEASVADYPGKKPRVLARGDSFCDLFSLDERKAILDV